MGYGLWVMGYGFIRLPRRLATGSKLLNHHNPSIKYIGPDFNQCIDLNIMVAMTKEA